MSAAKSWRLAAATLMLATVTALVSGCVEDSLPTCSDPRTEGVIKQIFFNEMAAQTSLIGPGPAWMEKVKQVSKINLAMVRTIKTNERYTKRSCEAELQVQLPNDRGAVAIEYTIQQTDDKKDTLVRMTGHVPLAVAISAAALSPEFMRATAAVSGSPPAVTAPLVSAKPSQPAPAASSSTSTSSAPTAAGPVKTVADATLIWLECQDLCHLQYKTAQGELKSALCTEAPVCQQWSQNPPEFKKHVGSRATLKLGSQFVPEGGATLDSVQGLEWGS